MVELSEGGKPAHQWSSSSGSGKSEKVTITLKKDHFFYLLAVAFLVVGFGTGFAVGGGDFDLGQAGGGTPSPSAGQQQQAPPPAPTAAAAGARVQVSIDDDPVLGDADAPVTIIEFSDYQCPFCGRHFQQTYPSLKKDYIDSGKVKLVFRDYPLSFHPEAEPAAMAAECVRKLDASKYFDYHDKVFQNQATMSAASYKTWATELGIDEGEFGGCFDGKETQAEVQADLAAGSAAGVSGTPSFFIGNPDDGYVKLVGAQPYSAFQAAIDAELA
jgi:protein-disulfide isomerase